MRSKCTLYLLFALALYIHPAQAQLITTFAGNGIGASTGTGTYTGDDGLAALAGLSSCSGVAFDGAGNIYIADHDNNVVRKVSYTGIITTFAGNGTAGYRGDDSAAASARLFKPYSVAVDAPGNVYIADYGNNVVRKVNTAGIITTYAGTGVAGYSGDGGAATAAKLSSPEGIAVDQYGNVFVTEVGNHVVREIFTSGEITTVAGNGTYGFSGNGGNATDAQLFGPASVTVDVYGNIYIADYYNNVVRMVDTNGIINDYAGSHTLGNSGDGGAAINAQLHYPSGVSIYGHGDVYISDQGNNNIRKVDASGIITHVAGTTTNGYTGDGGAAALAQLSSPKGLAVDGLGRVYVADYDNNVIRLIGTQEESVNSVTSATGISVYPNPANASFTVSLPAGNATVAVIDVTGRTVAVQTTDNTTKSITFNTLDMPTGSYFVRAVAGNKTFVQKVVVMR